MRQPFPHSSCRDKKDSEVQNLEAAKDYEKGSISELEQRNEAMREKLSNLKVCRFFVVALIVAEMEVEQAWARAREPGPHFRLAVNKLQARGIF